MPLPWIALATPPALVEGFADWDDDDRDGVVDWLQPRADDDDLVALAPVGPGPWRGFLTGDDDDVRVLLNGLPALGAGEPTSAFLPADGSITVQFGAPGATATLTLEGPESRQEWTLRSPPLLLADPLQPVEEVWVMYLPPAPGDPGTGALVADLRGVLGPLLTVVDGPAWDEDIWLQDQFELVSAEVGDRRMDVVLESGKGSAAGPAGVLAEALARRGGAALAGGMDEDSSREQWFGNLEVVPPHRSADGTWFPRGRLVVGSTGARPLAAVLATLGSAAAQPVLEIDTQWLCVRHADELIAVLPDPMAPQGFRVAIPSAARAVEILAAAPDAPLAAYRDLGTSPRVSRLGDLHSNQALTAYNLDLQRTWLDPLRRQLRRELGLNRDGIVEFPVLFQEAWDEEGRCGAVGLTPNLVNAVPLVLPDGPVLLLPDPKLRPARALPDADPFVQAVVARLPAGLKAVWLDGFDAWHVHRGGPHCATQVRRTPRR